MNLSNRGILVAAAVIVAVVGAEAYVRQQQAGDLRQAIEAMSDKLASTDAAARQAGVMAAQAGAKADQAGTTAAQAKETAAQALAVATTAKETADHAAAASAPPVGAATLAQTAGSAGVADLAAGRDLALEVCSNCHVVAPDQRFPPRLQPPALDFREIANRPATNEQSLQGFLAKPHGKMPDPVLAAYQVNLLVGYVMSLRDRH
jgi:mono/diheme cytochrome c family protein